MNDEAGSSQVSRLLDAALDLPPAERAAWVDTLDSTHDEIKPRLRALLARAAEVESRDFLGRLPAIGASDDEAGEESAAGQTVETAGGLVGPYQLQRQLGAGGMGTVWLATRADGMFERSIALKLPHRGRFGADLAERMARERGILAGLDHPNIARLYDAGLTTDGQPYLALEFVEGVPIDEYCRSRQCDLRERLRLFLQVADAVASAHARLVVHRDLKPANILVAHDGNVRLLDFGIAKLLDAPVAGEAPLTQLSIQAMTPDYASPEQILGEPVTIASDVYSLGVVLYELLTGERPYRLRRDTRGALEDAILQIEPKRPSESKIGYARALRGDLDTIVLKALRKKPAERYSTVNALVDDLRRHLAGHPVLARPDSAWYRTSRFVRRNRLAVAAAGVVSVALVTAAVIATVGLVQARAAEKRALAEAETTRQVSRFMVDLFKVADPGEARGNTITAREMLDKASVRVTNELSDAPEIRATLMATMAEVYARLGLYADAAKLAQPALVLREVAQPGSVAVADSLDQVGEIHMLMSRAEQAEPLHLRALALRRELQPPDHAAIARTLRNLGDDRDRLGKRKEALEVYRESREELARIANPDAAQLGNLLNVTANAHNNLGSFQIAADLNREALQVLRAGLDADHPDIGATLGDLAVALKNLQEYSQAEAIYQESLATQRKALGARHPFVAKTLSDLAEMYRDLGRTEEALALQEEATDIFRSALGDDHNQTNIARENAALSRMRLGQFETAESEFRAILAIYQRTLPADHPYLANSLRSLAAVLSRQSRFREAEPLAREALRIAEKSFGKVHWRVATMNSALGISLTGQRRYAEAEPVLLQSHSVMLETRGKSHRRTLELVKRLVDFYTEWGKQPEAARWQAELAESSEEANTAATVPP